MGCLSFWIFFFLSTRVVGGVLEEMEAFPYCCFFLSFYEQCFLWRTSYKPLTFPTFQGESRPCAWEEKGWLDSDRAGAGAFNFWEWGTESHGLAPAVQFLSFWSHSQSQGCFGCSPLCPNLGMSQRGHVEFLITSPILINLPQFILFSCFSSDNHVRTELGRLQKILLFCIHLEHLYRLLDNLYL